MKLNKLSTIIKNSNANFVSHAKYFLAAIGAVLIAAIIVISVMGLKLGFDFKGGTVVEIVYNIEYDEHGIAYEDGTPYTETLAKENAEIVITEIGGLEITSCQKASSTFGDKIVYKLLSEDKLTDEEISTLKAELYEQFNEYDAEGLLQSNYISVYSVDGTESNIAVYAAIALAVAIVLLAIAIFFRYGLSAALSLLITSIINIFLTFTVVILCRITVDVAFIGAVFTVFALTLISSIIFFDNIRDNIKNKNYKNFTRTEHANAAIKQSFSSITIILDVSLVCAILLTGLGTMPIRAFGFPVLGGIIFTALSAFYLAPYMWKLIAIKNIKKRK